MTKRKLRRQLTLTQVIMLGTAGTLAAEIFVLTGHAAGMAGPGAVIALLIGGLLSFSVALNYAELATTYPVAGGAMSYVREAYGSGILSYLVGSMDAMSSTFYAALSAVGFAYSLKVLIPGVPIIPVAIAVIVFFVLLNIVGVTQVGRVQVILGGFLLAIFGIYIVVGLLSPRGLSWTTFVSGEGIFIGESIWHNISLMLATIALVYNAYVGFEVIADDAEEVTHPDRNIPVAILVSLGLCTVIYVLVSLITIGTLPWQSLAGSETALTDAAARFLPRIGVPMMAFAGLVATLTSINSAMLSATREAFTLSRDGVWPRPFAKLSRFRTPYVAILFVGAASALIALIGLVSLLSYISSVGYLFVLFWGSLSMVRLRRHHPNLSRPFKAPFFPLTPYLAGVTCVLIVAFADWRALLFGIGVLGLFALAYILSPSMSRLVASSVHALEPHKDLILAAAGTPHTARSLVHLGAIVAQATEDTHICVLTVDTRSARVTGGNTWSHRRPSFRERSLLHHVFGEAHRRNVAIYTKSRPATSIADGILEEVASRDTTKLVLTGWPTPLDPKLLTHNVVKQVLLRAHTNVAVLLDRNLDTIRHILVPVGGGPHSRLAVRLAYEIAAAEGAEVTALQVLPPTSETEEKEDRSLVLQEIVEEVLGEVPANFKPIVVEASSVLGGILSESTGQAYDLIVIGASEEWALQDHLFGAIGDRIATMAECSVLLCRRYEPNAIAWVRRRIKNLERQVERRNGHQAALMKERTIA